MEPPSLKLFLLVVAAVFVLSSAAPIEEKLSTGCNTAKETVRSSVDSSVHLLADLDALANGVKRSGVESGCSGVPTESAQGAKKETLTSIKEVKIVNEDEVDKVPIVETGKAAIRSLVATGEVNNQTANATATTANSTAQLQGNATAALSSVNKGNATNGTASEVKGGDNSTGPLQGTAAKTFIASVNLNSETMASKRSHKPRTKVVKTRNGVKKSKALAAIQKKQETVIEDGPSMQRGSLSKETDSQENGATKSTANILAPLSSAIKSLDSASKLLGEATSIKSNAPASTAKSSDVKDNDGKVTLDTAAAVKPANGTSIDVSSSVRSTQKASAGTSAAAPSAAGPAAAPAAASVAKKPSALDPYAEIASGPDSPKMPDLKTGSDKAGLPVMKVDGSSANPEPVSFSKGQPEVEAPKALPSGSSNRPGPQDVGGILDQLTDKLNKGGVANENPLPPSESKTVMDQLTDFDHDALETAKGWESTGLKAIEKLKSAEFSHGNMKNELSKELSDRLAGDGYGAALGGSIDSGVPGPMVSNLDAPSQTSYPQQSYGHRQTSQWPEYGSMENLDTEAQREEQSFGPYDESHEGAYGGNSESIMSSEQNGYDRQEIPSFLNQGLVRDTVSNMPDQGQYYKRSIILRPYYYYYDHHLPYGFRHPYDD